jgi:hypothetical protein
MQATTCTRDLVPDRVLAVIFPETWEVIDDLRLSDQDLDEVIGMLAAHPPAAHLDLLWEWFHVEATVDDDDGF